jgi:branched-chain amino acid transport system substrate-binding protein
MIGAKKVIFSCFIVLLVTALIAVVAIGCARDEIESGVEVTEWNIPHITVLTGVAAAFGTDGAWGVDRAVEEINDSGGINGIPIRITRYDSEYDPGKSVQVMAQALGTDPLVIAGPLDDLTALASGGLAVDEGVPFMASLADPLSLAKFEPWGCSLYPDYVATSVAGTLEWIRLNPDIESIVIMLNPESGIQMAALEEQMRELPKHGIEVVGVVEVSFGQLDMGPQAVMAINLNPGGYYSHLQTIEHATMCKALYERGLTEGRRICAGMAVAGGPLFEIGEGYIEDIYLWDVYNFTSTDAGWLAYVADYEAEHNGLFPYTLSIQAFYESIYAVKIAFEELNITGDPTKLTEERIMIRDFLWNAKDIPSVTGGTWNWVNGEKVLPIYTYQVRNNNLQLISTLSTEEWYNR